VSRGTFVAFEAGPIAHGATSGLLQKVAGAEYARSCKYGDGIRYIAKKMTTNEAEKTATRSTATWSFFDGIRVLKPLLKRFYVEYFI